MGKIVSASASKSFSPPISQIGGGRMRLIKEIGSLSRLFGTKADPDTEMATSDADRWVTRRPGKWKGVVGVR
jgi:hypothetical protein